MKHKYLTIKSNIMNSVSIYEKRWLDLVFEGKNKSYGAYQLRLENSRTTVYAFLLGLLFFLSFAAIPILINAIGDKEVASAPVESLYAIPVQVSDFEPQTPPQRAKNIFPLAKEPNEVNNKTQLVDPEVVRSSEANQQIARNIENATNNVVVSNTGTGATTKQSVTGSESGSGSATSIATTTNDIQRTTSLDRLPYFPGGMNAFTNFIGSNFRTPESIDEQNTLRVFVAFVIEKDGSITDIKVLKDPGFNLGAEAIRVLKSLKIKWEPGLIAGQPVRTAYNLPITVRME